MGLYRKKPVVVEAVRWTGGPDQTEDPEWLVEAIEAGNVWFGVDCMLVWTLDGVRKARVGDYIIRGVAGELYPCKPNIFEQTYEEENKMNFGQALEALKQHKKLARQGWNGKGLYVQLNPARDFEFSELESFFTIKNVRNSFDTWVPSVSDLLAEDWHVVDAPYWFGQGPSDSISYEQAEPSSCQATLKGGGEDGK